MTPNPWKLLTLPSFSGSLLGSFAVPSLSLLFHSPEMLCVWKFFQHTLSLLQHWSRCHDLYELIFKLNGLSICYGYLWKKLSQMYTNTHAPTHIWKEGRVIESWHLIVKSSMMILKVIITSQVIWLKELVLMLSHK